MNLQRRHTLHLYIFSLHSVSTRAQFYFILLFLGGNIGIVGIFSIFVFLFLQIGGG